MTDIQNEFLQVCIHYMTMILIQLKDSGSRELQSCLSNYILTQNTIQKNEELYYIQTEAHLLL